MIDAGRVGPDRHAPANAAAAAVPTLPVSHGPRRGMIEAGAYLRATSAWPPAALDQVLGGPGPILVVAPHPDDESLGCGGLLATASAAGRVAFIVVLTDGAASHPAAPRAALAAMRAAETRDAATALGVPLERLSFLDLPDAALPADAAAAAAIADRILEGVPAPATILATWPHDPHRDHTAGWAIASAIGRRVPAARLLAYPVWGWAFAHPVPGFPLPTPPRFAAPASGFRLPVREVLAAKRRAIAAHRSQLGHGPSGGFRLPSALLALADRDFEVFLHTDPIQ